MHFKEDWVNMYASHVDSQDNNVLRIVGLEYIFLKVGLGLLKDEGNSCLVLRNLDAWASNLLRVSTYTYFSTKS